MVRRDISSKELLDFLKENYPVSYRKYKDTSDKMFEDMKDGIQKTKQQNLYTLLNKMCVKQGYQHGDIIVFRNEGFRNRGLLFWDALKEKVVQPTFEHSEASLPGQFLVGEGFFDPDHWKSLEYNPVRPCKALIKEIKTYYTKNPDQTSMNLVINGKKYVVEKSGENWVNYDWNKMVLVLEGRTPHGKLLSLYDYMSTDEKSVNEEKLRALLQGDNIKRNTTRKLDLEAKLVVAETKVVESEKQLEEAKAEVIRLRKELEGFGKSGTRRMR
jgi:hypothetical protein